MAIDSAYSRRRFGELTRLLRRRSGRSRKWIAERAGTDRSSVRAMERGKPVEPIASARVMAVMEQELREQQPAQGDRRSATEINVLSLAGHKRSLPESNDPETVLRMYLDLVCSVRGIRRRSSIVLRNADVDELSDVLHMPAEEVAALLTRLMAASINQGAS